MSKRSAETGIRLRGVRQHNLKNIDLDLPSNQLIVVTGLSGSGKSSLAFDTLFAEGQRRYIETFSPYARQFFDRMDKPAADLIEGIPPAIAIEQRNSVKTTRSTVGTMTEICDYMKMLWPHLSKLHCRQCGQIVRKDSPQRIWENLSNKKSIREASVTFDLPLSSKVSMEETLQLVSRQGYQRLLEGNNFLRLEEAAEVYKTTRPETITVVQDRVKLETANRSRFVEACEQAYHFGKGRLAVRPLTPDDLDPLLFSNHLHCATCDMEYREPSPALFSFNHPVGACPECKGFGRIITINYNLAVPDESLSLAEGVVKPWRGGFSAECQEDMMKFAAKRGVPTKVPFCDLPQKWKDWVVQGDPDYGIDKKHEWPHSWYGVKGYFRWLESKAYKMHVRVLLSRYRAYEVCPRCRGNRFQPDSLLYKIAPGHEIKEIPASLTLSDFYRLPIRQAHALMELMTAQNAVAKNDPLAVILDEIRTRLRYLVEVGLGYITLDRPTRSLSGGETERVNLTTCLGSRLVNTLFVLDEPSVGLHPRDTDRLVSILENLRDAGNTLVVVEHEPALIRAADHIVDLGPGHGESGGHVVFAGNAKDILKHKTSLTGGYLSGRLNIPLPARRKVSASDPVLELSHVTRHNIQNLNATLPLARFVCISGVSGSGKSTLIREVLYPALQARMEKQETSGQQTDNDEGDDIGSDVTSGAVTLEGWKQLGAVIMVDQSSLGKTPRSNPAVYMGAFDDIRDLFALSPAAKQRGLNSSAFSFNSAQGQCERCRGAGFEKIEMQFLSDIFIRCPECSGRRYRPHILEVAIAPEPSPAMPNPPKPVTIADVLDFTVDECLIFLSCWQDARPARKAATRLKWLQEVGLGYLRLGQPINTLSGGESQRLKLAAHIADASVSLDGKPAEKTSKPILFLFDEPTTGLHYEDIRILLGVMQKIVDCGHSIIVIEHNLEVVKSADWIIDLGPDAGDEGGRIVIAGTPEDVARCNQSHTGKALRSVLFLKESQ